MSARKVVNELLAQKASLPRISEVNTMEWSVNVDSLTDEELLKVVAKLAQRGIEANFERQLGFVAHFKLRWA